MSKLAGETISQPISEQYGFSYCIGRILSFSAEIQEESFLGATLKWRIEELPGDDGLEVINAASVRDIMDAETVVDCILLLARKRSYGTLDTGCGEGLTLGDIALRAAKGLNRTIDIYSVSEDEADCLVADTKHLKTVLPDCRRFGSFICSWLHGEDLCQAFQDWLRNVGCIYAK